MLTKLKYLTKEGFRNLRVNRLMTTASVSVLFSCLMLIGIAFMLVVNINAFIESIEAENVIMVYANTDITDYDYVKMGSEIEAIPYVASSVKVEKEGAYKEVLSELDDDLKAYLESLNENPLPDAYKVTVADMAHFDEVVNQVKLLKNVLRVHENSSLARELGNLKNSVQYISLGIIALLLIVSLFIISNTIKVTMLTRRLEISIMKSVGATNSFIRWPFMVEGMIIGVIAGLLATGAVWAIYDFALGSLLSSFTSFSSIDKVDFVVYAPWLALVFVGIGIFTGIFGSSTSIRKYLKERKFVELDD